MLTNKQVLFKGVRGIYTLLCILWNHVRTVYLQQYVTTRELWDQVMNIERHTPMSCYTRLLVLCIAFWQMAASAAEQEHEANEIAGFVGLAHEHSDYAPALGLEYERRISATLGIGLLAERTLGDFDSWVYALPFTFHVDEWKFIVAPGIEEKHGHTEDLLRVGVGLEYEMNEIKVTPGFSVDFVNSETIYVLGISFGIGF